MTSIAVIGGGIAGLAAAHAALGLGAERVVVFEAGPVVGGKLRTSPFAGHPAIDEGPDAFLARVPWATALAREVGLGEQLTSPTGAPAWVYWNRMHAIPGGLLLGVPTGIRQLAASALLTWRGKLRAATEPFRPRSDTSHDTLGRWVRERFGTEVHERLVDPLIGSIYAADTDHFSLAAVPQIAQLAAAGRSALWAARHRPAPEPGPVFYAPTAGMAEFAAATAHAVGAGGGEVRCGAMVGEIAAAASSPGHTSPGAWMVDDERFDAVVLACPSPEAARLLATTAPDAVAALTPLPIADVVMVTLAVPADQWPERCVGHSGYLVPKPQQRLVTAASFGSQKWSHWDDGRNVILRVSLGRDGLAAVHLHDDVLREAAVGEVGQHLGVDLQPTDVRITRWPRAFPQYRPHHADTVARIEHALPPTVAVAGAAYHGIGIPACVRSGQQAARRVLDACRDR